MSVKRYEWMACDEHACHCDVVESAEGDMVDYEDYAALEARCAALAAENGQMLRLLTDISENHDEYVNQDEYLYAGVPMDYVSEINAYVSRDVEAENPFKATDAFLAEVRASGVEAAIDTAKNVVAQEFQYKDFETAQRVCSKFPESDLVGKVEMVEWLADFADQLRKGAQS